jgi:hypothetical protein
MLHMRKPGTGLRRAETNPISRGTGRRAQPFGLFSDAGRYRLSRARRVAREGRAGTFRRGGQRNFERYGLSNRIPIVSGRRTRRGRV